MKPLLTNNLHRLPPELWALGAIVTLSIFIQYGRMGWHSWGKDETAFIQWTAGDGWGDLWNYFRPSWGWHYRPLLMAYFVAVRLIFGDVQTPFLVVNLILHAAIITGVALLGKRLCGNAWIGVLAALIFVVNTANNEAVNWIAATNVLAVTLLTLACINLWWSAYEQNRPLLRLAAAGLVCAGLLMKEEAVQIPLFLLALDFVLEPRTPLMERARRFAPMAAGLAVYVPLAVIAHRYVREFQVAATFYPAAGLVVMVRSIGRIWGSWSFIASLACVAAFAWPNITQGRQRLVPLWLSGSAVCLALVVGAHVDRGRFQYLPSVFGALMVAAALLDTEAPIGRRALVVAIAAFFSNPGLDALANAQDSLVPHWVIAGATLVAIGVLAGLRTVDVTVSVLLLLALVCGQLDYIASSTNPAWGQWFGVGGIFLAALLAHRSGTWKWWQAVAFISVVLMDVEMLPVLVLVSHALIYGYERMAQGRQARIVHARTALES